MKTQIKEIELALRYVTELQDAGCHEFAYNVASIAQNRLGRLIEGMNQNDTKVKELPKYWVVKRDESNPLWEEFKEWFINRGGSNPDDWDFSGYDANEINRSGLENASKVELFRNSPELITLEYWNECINELL